MTLHEWLDQKTGRAIWLAGKLGVSKGAVSLWREAGVPMDRMSEIADLTAGDVTAQAMCDHALACRDKRRLPTAVAPLESKMAGA